MIDNQNVLGNTPNPRNALIRMLIVLAIAAGVIFYSYGYTVTEIDLAKPTEERRQENLQNALRELFSPDLFDQEVDIRRMEAEFLVGCDVELPLADITTDEGVLEITPRCGDPGDEVKVVIRDFERRVDARIRWIPPGEDAEARPREVLETGRAEFVLDDNGDFTGTIEVPRIRGGEDQIHTISVLAAVPTGAITWSKISRVVYLRMWETIFMALVATSVAIPVATFLSFFAARNLMRPIRLSMGSTLLGFLGFALGALLSGILLKPIVERGFELSNGGAVEVLIGLGLLVAIIGGGLVLYAQMTIKTQMANREKPPYISIAQSLLVGLLVAFVVGLAGGVLLSIGDSLIALQREGGAVWRAAAGGVGNVLAVVGGVIELTTGLIAMIVGGFVFSGVVSSLFSAPLRKAPTVPNHLLGGVLGALSGGVLFYVLGLLGAWAALLGLLAPIVAALLGGAIAVLIYRRFAPRDIRKRRYEPDFTDDLLWWLLYAIGAIIIFWLTFSFLNIRIALVNGVLPSESRTELLGLSLQTYVVNNILVGVIMGGTAGILTGTKSSFALGSTLYNVSRTLLNAVRSTEPLIMGLVFVIWVGIGPFAGVLALLLHSIAALGKLYSEQVESIDSGPIEALESTGAGRLQTIVYGVVPQIISPYISFTMYRWDINARMSTIIGLVGGGGVGMILQQQMNLLDYSGAGVAVLAIAVVVSILDYISAYIRSKIM